MYKLILSARMMQQNWVAVLEGPFLSTNHHTSVLGDVTREWTSSHNVSKRHQDEWDEQQSYAVRALENILSGDVHVQSHYFIAWTKKTSLKHLCVQGNGITHRVHSKAVTVRGV